MYLGKSRLRAEHVDTDSQGVVHFSRYLSMFETSALRALSHHGVGLRRWAQDGQDLTVSSASATYRAPARYADDLDIRVTVARVTAARFHLTIHATTPTGAETLAEGELVFCLVDRRSGQPQELPRDLRSILTHGDRVTESRYQ